MPNDERPSLSTPALERRVDRLTAAVGVLAVGLALSLAWNLLPRERLEAKRFLLRGGDGRWRGSLEIDPAGLPTIRLNDRAGKAAIYGVVFDDGTQRLRLGDSTGTSRLVLELGPDGTPYVQLVNTAGRSGLRAWLGADGRPWVHLRWGAAEQTWSLPDSTPSVAKSDRPRDRVSRGRR